MRRPIKHILDDFIVNEAGNVIRNIPLVRGVTAADPYGAAQSQVNAGSAVITSIELIFDAFPNVHTAATADIYDRFHWYIWFNVAGSQTRPDPIQAGISDLKNQIIHQDCAVSNTSTAVLNSPAMQATLLKWHLRINIPKWAQKINKDDQIELVYFWTDPAANHDFQLKAIFMEYEQS